MDTIKKLNYLFDKKRKISIVVLLIIIMLGSLAELAGVAIIMPVVNLAISPDFANNKFTKIIMSITGLSSREDIMLVLIGATIAIYIFKNIYLSAMQAKINKFAVDVRGELATRLLNAYLAQPYSFFLKKDSSEIIRSVDTDTASLYDVIFNGLMLISNALTAMALLITIIVINPVIAIVLAILLSACTAFITKKVQKKTKWLGDENQRLTGNIIKYLQQSVEGIKEIKILGNEEYFKKQFTNTYYIRARVIYKYKLLNVIPKYLIETVCISGIMGYLAVIIKFDSNYMEVIPQIALLVTAAYKLLPAVNAMYSYANTIMFHKASINLVYNDIKDANELDTKEGLMKVDVRHMSFDREIAVNNLSFNYENSEKSILKNVNINIPKGKSVALIGPSGGGKTTTADLCIGLLKPIDGDIEVDGVNIADNLEGWRSMIGYIPQNIYLTDDSIASNIALGTAKEKIDYDKVRKALKEAQLLEFVEGMEDGLETKVGERGVRLSGGQRQRIGIARALYHNPEILVFDEATSALDNETEKEVMKSIDGLHGNKTMIMIAHRLSTIENCDIVYKVEGGKVTRER